MVRRSFGETTLHVSTLGQDCGSECHEADTETSLQARVHDQDCHRTDRDGNAVSGKHSLDEHREDDPFGSLLVLQSA
jgi:hypothetical protein